MHLLCSCYITFAAVEWRLGTGLDIWESLRVNSVVMEYF